MLLVSLLAMTPGGGCRQAGGLNGEGLGALHLPARGQFSPSFELAGDFLWLRDSGKNPGITK